MTEEVEVPMSRFIRVGEVAEILGIKIPTVWTYNRELSDFPKSIPWRPRVTVWDTEEVQAYRRKQMEQLRCPT